MYITCNAAALVSFNIGASELLNQKDMMHVHTRDFIPLLTITYELGAIQGEYITIHFRVSRRMISREYY